MHSSDKRAEKSSRLGRWKIAVGGEARIKCLRAGGGHCESGAVGHLVRKVSSDFSIPCRTFRGAFWGLGVVGWAALDSQASALYVCLSTTLPFSFSFSLHPLTYLIPLSLLSLSYVPSASFPSLPSHLTPFLSYLPLIPFSLRPYSPFLSSHCLMSPQPLPLPSLVTEPIPIHTSEASFIAIYNVRGTQSHTRSSMGLNGLIGGPWSGRRGCLRKALITFLAAAFCFKCSRVICYLALF